MSAFSDCTSLSGEIVIPNGVTRLYYATFMNCSLLTSVIIGEGVERINGEVFSGCTNLQTVVIGSKVNYIEPVAFSGCNNLTSVTFNNPNGWYFEDEDYSTTSPVDFTDPENNAEYINAFEKKYYGYYWKRTANSEFTFTLNDDGESYSVKAKYTISGISLLTQS